MCGGVTRANLAPVARVAHNSSQQGKISWDFLTLDGHPSPFLKKTVACGLPALDCRQWDGVDTPDSVPETRRPETSQASDPCCSRTANSFQNAVCRHTLSDPMVCPGP
jgi:hypothetical protein